MQIKNIIFLFLTIGCFLTANCSTSKNPCGFSLNPDISCRFLDEQSDGSKLVEYFNLDTNELRLVIKNSNQEIEITHPSGRVKNFNNKIDSNKIQFDKTDSHYLIVNGERFAIVKKE